jgi:pyridoxal phosphate enzyme (YggS family)
VKNTRENIEFVKNALNSVKDESVSVELVAVTKTFPPEDVLEALNAGIKHIGESRIQEALPKFGRLGSSLAGVTKHFIGRLQSNKVKKAVENFDLIHSLDSMGLACDIGRRAADIGKVQNCLIEVKISGEVAKAGIKPDELRDFYRRCLSIPDILIKGLMVIAPYSNNSENSRSYFKEAHSLFEDMKKSFGSSEFNILSMGMSGDYKVAVEEGATMVRIGSAIFGDRNYETE